MDSSIGDLGLSTKILGAALINMGPSVEESDTSTVYLDEPNPGHKVVGPSIVDLSSALIDPSLSVRDPSMSIGVLGLTSVDLG